MTFGGGKNPIIFYYKVSNISLDRVYIHRDLGMLFDNKLTFNFHIEKTVLGAYRALGFIIRVCKNFNNLKVAKLLYISLVRPKVECVTAIWTPSYCKYINRIERVQK